MKKVIFVPGFMGGKKDSIPFKIILKDFEVIPFNYDTLLRKNIENISKDLKKFIDNLNLKKGEKVSIIGFSAGGIIADYYLKFLDSTKVDKFVSLCSPFKGSYLVKFFSKKLKELQQLDTNSDFLKKLNKNKLKVKMKSIWCKFDFIVPGESAKRENPKHTYFFIHLIVHLWPPVLFEIRRFLE